MSETSINNNQIRGGGIKILNVVQNGTLTRDGAVFSGFSTSNYLQPGARVDKGILSLDSSTYVKNFTPILTADNWKIKAKFYHKLDTTQTYNAQALLSIGYSWLLVGNSVDFYLHQNQSTQLMALKLEGADNYYNFILQVELIYSNVSGYTLNLYDENNVLLLTNSNSLTTNLFSSNIILCTNSSRYLFDDLYINDCSIEINDEIWWKGVETI